MKDNQRIVPEPVKVVTDCCGRLLPEAATLRNDVHFTDLCPACQWLDWSEQAPYMMDLDDCPEHEAHVTCINERCPGRDWSYASSTTGGIS